MAKKKHRSIPRNACRKIRRSVTKGSRPHLWALAGLFVLLIVLSRPELQPLRDSTGFDIVRRLSMSVPFLFFAFFHKGKPPAAGQAAVAMTALTAWLPLAVSDWRMVMLWVLVTLYILCAVVLWYRLARERFYTVTVAALLYLCLLHLAWLEPVNMAGEGKRFWLPGILLGLIAAAAAAALLASGRLRLKDDRPSERIALVLGALMLSLVLFWPTFCNLNYSLDRSAPEVWQTPVEEKDISTAGKTVSYYLYVTVEGKQVRMEVDQSDYYASEIGDMGTLEWYAGFLGEPYYLFRSGQ